jgi:hypothetical protein
MFALRSRRLRGRASAGDINIHNDGRNTVNRSRSKFGVFPDCRVTDAAREFYDAVMYLNADGAVDNILVTIKLCDHVFLYLNIVFHQHVPS